MNPQTLTAIAHEPGAALARLSRKVSQAASLGVLAIAVGILLAWTLGMVPPRSWPHWLRPSTPLQCFAFILLSLSVFLIQTRPTSLLGTVAHRGIPFLSLALGFTLFIARGGLLQPQPTIVIALFTVILSFVLILIQTKGSRKLSFSKALVVLLFFAAGAIVVGQLYSGVLISYGGFESDSWLLSTGMSASLFLVLSVAVILARPSDGLMSLILSDSDGGKISRWAVPLAVVVPSLIEIVLGFTEHVFDLGPLTEKVLVTLLLTSIAVVLTLRAAAQAARADAVRDEIERGFVRAQRIGEFGSWDWSVLTGVIQGSAEAFRILGLPVSGALANLKLFFKQVHPEDRPRVEQAVMAATKEGRPYAIDYRIIRPSGEMLYVHAQGEVERNELGKPLRMYGTFHNITQRKRAEESLRQAKESAEKANHTKDIFLATLSHELRTPLTAILSWSQLLKSGRLDPSKAAVGLQVIEDSALSQNQLINDLLDISRISVGKIVLDIQNVELMEIVEKVINSLRVTAEKKSIHISVDLGSMPLFVAGDSGRLKQIVWNLLTNAIKFTPLDGKIEVRLSVCHSPSEDRVQLSIRDSGKGISAAFLPHIFDQFSQADSSSTRVHGGLGLGLALVDSLTKLQGGTVEAQSEGAGKGATFIVSFPLSSSARFTGVVYERHKPTARLDLGGISVLCVDDEPFMLGAIQEVLSSFGAQVRLASSVTEALVEFEKSRPDVILSDIAMPFEDGYSLIRKIRKLGPARGGQTPAVALTAHADSQSRELALSAGYQAHLAKPVDSEELAQAVLRALH